LLDQISQIKPVTSEVKWTENSLLQRILLTSVTAYAYSRQGKEEEALVTAEKAFGLLSLPQRTLFIGITHLASSLISITAIECWRRLAEHESDLGDRASKLVFDTTRLLKNFANKVPFAAPRAALCEGVSLCIQGKQQEGVRHLLQTELMAVTSNMPMERALAIYYKCVFSSKDGAVQDALLTESIFTSIGADYEARMAKALLY